MAIKIIGIVCAIALAVSGGIFGARWIEARYRAERAVLSFPERLTTQDKRRGGIGQCGGGIGAERGRERGDRLGGSRKHR